LFIIPLVVLPLLIFNFGSAQPTVDWDKRYGGEETDSYYSMIQTSDGGYAILGSTNYSLSQNMEPYFIKINAFGNMEWSKIIEMGTSLAPSLVQTTDGGFVFLQRMSDYYNFIKIDAAGTIVMNRTGPFASWIQSFIQTSDGGYATIGRQDSLSDTLFQKWDSEMNLNIQTNITGKSSPNSVVQTSDGGYAIVGGVSSIFTGSQETWMAKLTAFGDLAWTYGTNENATWSSVIQTIDDGFVIVGASDWFDSVLLTKMNASGNVEWSKTYGGSGTEYGRRVIETVQGKYTVLGNTFSFGAGNSDAWLFKIDESGNMIWNQTYGGIEIDNAMDMVRDSDGGYVLAGITNSSSSKTDIWHFKVVFPQLAVSTNPASTTVTTGHQATFTATATGGGPPYTYQWYEGTTPMAGETSNQLSITKSAAGPYTYYCNVADSEGVTRNSNTASLTVTSESSPTPAPTPTHTPTPTPTTATTPTPSPAPAPTAAATLTPTPKATPMPSADFPVEGSIVIGGILIIVIMGIIVFKFVRKPKKPPALARYPKSSSD
jgi:plastocyanin